MAEKDAVKSRRDQHLERLRKKYPDKQFEDDEEIYGQISDDYDNYEKDLANYREQEKTLSDMFSASPQSAQFLADMHNGVDPVVGLVQRFGMQIRDVLDNPEMLDKLAEANKEYVERVAKSKALDEEYAKNMATSLETLKQFQQERGMTDEQIDEVAAAIIGVVRDGVKGKFAHETLELFVNAINHDNDVAAAGEEGRVAGRNDKIVEGLRKREQGDGTAPLSGKNGTSARRKQNIFELANEAL